jgi:hypothetical protein
MDTSMCHSSVLLLNFNLSSCEAIALPVVGKQKMTLADFDLHSLPRSPYHACKDLLPLIDPLQAPPTNSPHPWSVQSPSLLVLATDCPVSSSKLILLYAESLLDIAP